MDKFKETVLNNPAEFSVTKSQNFDQLTDGEKIAMQTPTYTDKIARFFAEVFLKEAHKAVAQCKVVARLTPKQVDLSSVWGKNR